MGKRYKKGNKGKKPKNRGRKRRNENGAVFKLEQEINEELNDFIKLYHLVDFNSIDDYDMMYAKKENIKKLIRKQQEHSYVMNYRRYQFLEEQLDLFKRVYTGWKKKSYRTFLIYRMHVPSYLVDNFYCE